LRPRTAPHVIVLGSETHFINSRRDWATRARVEIRLHHVQRAERSSVNDNESEKFARLHEAVLALQNNHGFVVIDTPPSDSFLMRLAHGLDRYFGDAAQ
jgi:chromosome partitioning protein